MDCLAAHIHECIIAASGGVVVAWLTGVLNQFLPSPSRVRLALTNILWRRPAHNGNGFRLVLCWPKSDHSGEDTETVEEAFRGISGITLVRSVLLSFHLRVAPSVAGVTGACVCDGSGLNWLRVG